LAYLYNNKHMTPFEMAGMIIEVQAPIFVFREWHRHRTQSYNELSARYTPLPDENYVPTVGPLHDSVCNEQASGKNQGRRRTHARASVAVVGSVRKSYAVSRSPSISLDPKWGIPKEVARLPVPVARYSRMRASTNLRNWLGFLTLRSDMNPMHSGRFVNSVMQWNSL
jgi:thymidylate synthase (FAD)